MAFFVATFVCDVIFWQTGNSAWSTASLYLLGAALIMSALAALAGLTDFLGDHRIRDLDGGESAYLGHLGDAGAVCSIVAPDALRVERLPVRIELAGYGRGQTVVDRRRLPGEDLFHGLADGWAEVDVALEIDDERVAELFLDTVVPSRAADAGRAAAR